MAETPSSNSGFTNGQIGCFSVVGILLLLMLISQCSSSKSGDAKNATMQFSQAIGESISSQSPPPVQPLNAAAVRAGIAGVRGAINSEGISGAMIFSQNCYESLTHTFAWKRLDTCGAADMLAVRSAENSYDTPINEAAYFDSEAAAGRYLEAATKAGEDPSDADLRLETLKSKVINSALPKPTPSTEATEEPGPSIWDQVEPADADV